MTIAGELEFGFFCGNFSQNQNLIWNDPVESHQMGISHFFYRVFTNRGEQAKNMCHKITIQNLHFE